LINTARYNIARLIILIIASGIFISQFFVVEGTTPFVSFLPILLNLLSFVLVLIAYYLGIKAENRTKKPRKKNKEWYQ